MLVQLEILRCAADWRGNAGLGFCSLDLIHNCAPEELKSTPDAAGRQHSELKSMLITRLHHLESRF